MFMVVNNQGNKAMIIFWPLAYFALPAGTKHRGWKSFGIALGVHTILTALYMSGNHS